MPDNSPSTLHWLLERPWLVLAVGVGDITIVIALHHYCLLSALASDILKEIGIAIAIIGFVSWSVERARVQSFTDTLTKFTTEKLDEIKNKTVRAIFQGPLPGQYYERISKTMFRNSFLRTDWIVRMELNWTSAEHEFLSVQIEQTYKIKNLGSVPETYEIYHYESTDWDDKFPGSTTLHHVRAEYDDDTTPEIKEPQDEANPPWTKSEEGLTFKRRVEIQPGSILSVDAASSKIMRDRQYESRSIGQPTMGAKFFLKAPEDLTVFLEVPVELLGEIRQPLKVSEQRELDGRLGSYWKVPCPLPPSACIFINWRRSKQDATNTGNEG